MDEDDRQRLEDRLAFLEVICAVPEKIHELVDLALHAADGPSDDSAAAFGFSSALLSEVEQLLGCERSTALQVLQYQLKMLVPRRRLLLDQERAELIRTLAGT